MNPSIRLVLLTNIPDDPHLFQQWNALVQKVSQPQVFYTWQWSMAVQRAYQATLRPLIFLAYDEDESLCGVAALALDAAGRASFLCANTGDYCDFLSLPGHKAAFVTAVLDKLKKRGIEKITLTNLPADSDSVAGLQKASTVIGYRVFARTAYLCAQVLLSKLERRAGDTMPLVPGHRLVRRKLNALKRMAPSRLEHAHTWDEVNPILSKFMDAHVARFQATGRVSPLATPERRLFLEELSKLLAGPGWVVLTQLTSGDKPFAWNYGFQFNGVWFWYQPTFDSALEKYSPGFCLLSMLVAEAADDPSLHMVDLGLGAEEYKERFANQTRETLYLTLRASAVQHAKEIVRYRAAKIVQASPKVEAAARAVLKRMRRSEKPAPRDTAPKTESV